MRKSFLLKSLTWFLSGTLLASVGCKSYDDDIDALNKEVNDLKGEVVELNKLEDRIKAVEQTAAEFRQIDFSQYVTNDKLAGELKKIQTAFDDKLKGYVTSGELASAKKSLEALIAGKCTMGEVLAELDKYVKKADVYTKPEIEAKINELKALITKLTNDTDNWLGDHFEKYMKKYVTSPEFTTAVAGAASAAVLEQLEKANADYVKAIGNILDSFDGDKKIIRQSDLNPILEDYDRQIEEIWSAIGELASRIQSLVYVPTTSNGQIEFGTPMLGTVKLTSNPKVELTYRVTPASLAAILVDKCMGDQGVINSGPIKFSFQAEEVTRAAAPSILIIGAKAADNGKIVLLTSTEYPFAQKDLALAFCISEQKEGIQGIEFSSPYVTATNDSGDVTANFVLARKAGDKYADYSTKAAYELVYNSTEAITLMNDYALYYKSGSDYLTIDQAKTNFNWDVTPALEYEHSDVTTGTTVTLSKYTIAPTNPLADATTKKTPVSIQVKTSDKTEIGKAYTLTSKAFVTVGAVRTAMAEASVTAVATVVRKPLADIANANGAIDWNFTDYTADSYSIDEIFIDKTNALTKEQFMGLDIEHAVWTIEKPADSKLVGNLVVTAEKVSAPYVGTDSKVIKYTVKGYKNGTGSVGVSTTIDVNDNETVKISGTITFNGLPDMSYTITGLDKAKYTVPGEILVSIDKKFNETMYKKLPSGQKFFANPGEFDAFLATAALNVTPQIKNTAKNIAGATLLADNGNKTLDAQFTKADVDFNKAASYTYVLSATDNFGIAAAGFKIALSGSVTITKDNNYYLAQDAGLFTDDPVNGPYVWAYGKTVTATPVFAVEQVELTSGYSAKIPAGNTDPVVVTYTLKTVKPNGYTGTLPTIDGAASGITGTLDWNGCQLDMVKIEASMTVNGLVVDTKTFNVKLQKPIEFGSWTAFALKKVEVVSNGTDAGTTNLYDLMKDNAKDIFGNKLLNATGKEAWASNTAAYGLDVAFGTPKYTSSTGAENFTRFKLDPATGILTVKADNTPLAGTITAVVPVTFTYKYAVEPNGQTPAAYVATKFVKNVTIEYSNKK